MLSLLEELWAADQFKLPDMGRGVAWLATRWVAVFVDTLHALLLSLLGRLSVSQPIEQFARDALYRLLATVSSPSSSMQCQS